MADNSKPAWFEANGGTGVLQDTLVQPVKRRDFLDEDVCGAVSTVRENERRAELADKYGEVGAERAGQWVNRVQQVGPDQAGHELYHAYKTAPIGVAEPEPINESDSPEQAAVRKSIHQLKQRQSPEAHARARAHVDSLAQAGVNIDQLARMHQQMVANPDDAAPRIVQQIKNDIAEAEGMRQAEQTLKNYPHKFHGEASEIAQQLLYSGHLNGLAEDKLLPVTQAYTKWVLAAEEQDPYRQDAISAKRRVGGFPMFKAEVLASRLATKGSLKGRRLGDR